MLVLAVILNVVDFVLFLDARACHGAWAAPYLAMAQVILVYWLVEKLMKRGTVLRSDPGALAWMALVLIVAGWFLVAKSQETPRPYVGILVTIAVWAPHRCSHRSRWEAKEIRWTMSCGTRAATLRQQLVAPSHVGCEGPQ